MGGHSHGHVAVASAAYNITQSPNSFPLFWMGGMVSSAYFIRVFRFLCYTCRFGAEKILRTCYHCRVASEDSLSVCICRLYTHPGPWSETVHTIWDVCAIVYHTPPNPRSTSACVPLSEQSPVISVPDVHHYPTPLSPAPKSPSPAVAQGRPGAHPHASGDGVIASSRSTGKSLRNHGSQNKSRCSGPSESSFFSCGWCWICSVAMRTLSVPWYARNPTDYYDTLSHSCTL
jgi:hypothetical protein